MSWQKAIILNPNEQVLHSWDGNCERHHQAVEARMKIVGIGGIGHKTVDSKETHSGTLVLTSQRFIWFERRGLLSKTERASFEIDLRNLKGVTCGGALVKWVSITDSEAEYIFHLKDVGKKEIEPFRDMILRQVEKVKETAMGGTPLQKEIITKEIVMLPCEYCQGLMPQTSVYCPNCGAQKKH